MNFERVLFEHALSFECVLFEFTYNSETNGDGAKMSNEGQTCPSLDICAPKPHRKYFRRVPLMQPHMKNQRFSCGDPDLPRPHWFQHVPVSGVRRNLLAGAPEYDVSHSETELRAAKPNFHRGRLARAQDAIT